MIEKGKHAYDKGRMVGTIFIDLSKAFGTLDHNFLLAKLNSYGFSFNAIKFIQAIYRNDFIERLSPRHGNTGLVSSGASLTSWGEVAFLALVDHPSVDGVTIKMPYVVDVFPVCIRDLSGNVGCEVSLLIKSATL